MKKKTDSKEIELLVKLAEEWENKYLRALADYQNLEKRVEARKREERQFATGVLVLKLLPVFDTLEKVASISPDLGLKLAVKQLRDVLKSETIEKIVVIGKRFDPRIMECVEVVVSDKEDEVIEEVRSGYKMFDQVIRVAQVKVGKRKIEKRAEELVKEEFKKGDYM